MDFDWKIISAGLGFVGTLIAIAYKDPKAHNRIIAPIFKKIIGSFFGLLTGVIGMGVYSSITLSPYIDPAKQKDAEQVKLVLAMTPFMVLGFFILFFFCSLALDKLAKISIELVEEKKTDK